MRDARSFVPISNILPIIALYKKRLYDNQPCLVFHLLLDVFPIQIPKSSLLGPGPAIYKSPCPRGYYIHNPH
jgi:hypothetical protein